MSTDKIETFLTILKKDDTLFRLIAMMTPEEKENIVGGVIAGVSAEAKASILTATFEVMVQMKKEGFLSDGQVAAIGTGISNDLLLTVKARCEAVDRAVPALKDFLVRVSVPCCGPTGRKLSEDGIPEFSESVEAKRDENVFEKFMKRPSTQEELAMKEFSKSVEAKTLERAEAQAKEMGEKEETGEKVAISDRWI